MLNVNLKDEEMYFNDEMYKIIKADVDFNKPFGNIYFLNGINLIIVNANAPEEENKEVISELLNNTNPFKGIFEGISKRKIVSIEENSTLGELKDTEKLSEYIDEIDGSEDAYLSDTWKMLMFYKLGVMKGKREERNKKKSKNYKKTTNSKTREEQLYLSRL